MHVRRAALVGLVFMASVGAAQRQPAPPPNPLSLVASFSCTFPTFVATEWPGGRAVTREGKDEQFFFKITDINTRRSTARIVGSVGSVPASAMLGETGLNVVEQTALGNFILTSIFKAGGNGRVYLAAHSRHLGDLETPPSVSQHFGTCEADEPAAGQPKGR